MIIGVFFKKKLPDIPCDVHPGISILQQKTWKAQSDCNM